MGTIDNYRLYAIINMWSRDEYMKQPICRNCKLFDSKQKRCAVIILCNGEKFNLPVEADDACFYENEFLALNDDNQIESFKPEVQQVKFWVENERGEKTDKSGKVFIEYPEHFFGDEKQIIDLPGPSSVRKPPSPR